MPRISAYWTSMPMMPLTIGVRTVIPNSVVPIRLPLMKPATTGIAARMRM